MDEVLRHERFARILRLAQHLLDHAVDGFFRQLGPVAQPPSAPLELRHAALDQRATEHAHRLPLATLPPRADRPHQRRLGHFVAASWRALSQARLHRGVARVEQISVAIRSRTCGGGGGPPPKKAAPPPHAGRYPPHPPGRLAPSPPPPHL